MSPILGRSRVRNLRREELYERLQALERRLAKVSNQAGATAYRTTDDAASTLRNLAIQLRSGAASAGDQALQYGGEAAERGQIGVRWLSKKARVNPLSSLAIAAGVGLLIGLFLPGKR